MDFEDFDVGALLFDCDGVLVDSHSAAAVAWNAWAQHWAPGFDFLRDVEHGRRIRDVVAELVGDPDDVDTAAAELRQRELDCATDVRPIPGACELVDSCPAGQWAVVTSGGRVLARARMASAGIATPDVLVTGEDVEHGKPSPDPYLLAARRLGIDPGRCAVFEDAPAGIASARAAGVATVIGVGDAAVAAEVTVAVADLRGIDFDGGRLRIAAHTILPRDRR